MSYVYAVEDYQSFIMDATPLWKKHYEEVSLESVRAVRPLAVDIKKGISLAEQGLYPIFTIRDSDTKELLGYAAFLVHTPLHYRTTVYASNDLLYFSECLRKGMQAVKFMKWCDKKLVELSKGTIKLIQWRTKANHNFGVLLERQGYSADDVTYSKWVGE